MICDANASCAFGSEKLIFHLLYFIFQENVKIVKAILCVVLGIQELFS